MCYQQTVLNNNVLSCGLKTSSEMSGVCRSTSKLYHTTRPLMEKLRSQIWQLLICSSN